MSLSDAAHVAVLLGMAMLVGVVVASLVVAFRLRRWWRARRRAQHPLLRWMPASIPAAGLGVVATTVASPSWWLVQRDRHAMWRSVAGAQRAVSVAVRADAPVGDLPALMRQLQRAATGVDAAMRASGSTRRLPRDVAAERVRLETAAADIRAAAVESLAACGSDVESVVSAVAVEVAAVAEGLRSARLTRLPAR